MNLPGTMGPLAAMQPAGGGEDELRKLLERLLDPQTVARMLRETGDAELDYGSKQAAQRRNEARRGFAELPGLSDTARGHVLTRPGVQRQSEALGTASMVAKRNALREAGLNPDATYATGVSAQGRTPEEYAEAVRKRKAQMDQTAAATKADYAKRQMQPQPKKWSASAVTKSPDGKYQATMQVGGAQRKSKGGFADADSARSYASEEVKRQQAALDALRRTLSSMMQFAI